MQRFQSKASWLSLAMLASLALAGCKRGASDEPKDEVVYVKGDDPKMSAAIAKAQGSLDKYRIGVPVEILVMIGEGEYSTETGMRVHWSTPACCGPGYTQADAQSLILEERGTTSTEDYCEDMNPVGYNLYYQDRLGQRDVHLDGDVLPKSRGCTLHYRIHAVIEPYSDYYAPEFTSRRVAIIASYPFGFEGVDRRFLAVPIDR